MNEWKNGVSAALDNLAQAQRNAKIEFDAMLAAQEAGDWDAYTPCSIRWYELQKVVDLRRSELNDAQMG